MFKTMGSTVFSQKEHDHVSNSRLKHQFIVLKLHLWLLWYSDHIDLIFLSKTPVGNVLPNV